MNKSCYFCLFSIVFFPFLEYDINIVYQRTKRKDCVKKMEEQKKKPIIDFNQLADKQVGAIYLLMSVFLTVAYTLEVIEGSQPPGFLIAFVTADWGAFIASLIAKKIRHGKGTLHHWVLCIGYSMFYILILSSLKNPLIFVYIVPILIIMALYQNFKLLLLILAANVIGVVSFIISTVNRGAADGDMIDSFKIVFAASIMMNLAVYLLIRYLIKLNNHNVAAVTENLERVKETVEKVKEVSTTVVDGVNAVKEYADDNRAGATSVVNDMSALTEQTNILTDRTYSSLEMTKTISNQVTQVSNLVEETVALAQQSVEHASTSNDQLQDAMASAREMKDLASQVETILVNFKEEFGKVKVETGTINNISSQTNLLALNASIESARAGEAGRGFSVVADEIRNLSEGTKQSSASIMTALDNLSSTSENMTVSIERIIELIAKTAEKIETVAESVSAISSDSVVLGTNVNNINEAISEVETSNTQLVENMNSVNDVMGSIVVKIVETADSSEEIRSKNEETSAHVISIEHTVNTLIEELSSTGLMTVSDVQEDMVVSLKPTNSDTVYKGMVSDVTENVISITFEADVNLTAVKACDISIVVNNNTYHWANATMLRAQKRTAAIMVEGQPTVANRRKYPRLSLISSCEVTLKSGDAVSGNMVNVSANGLSFTTQNDEIKMGELLSVRIAHFPVQTALSAVPIRKAVLANGSTQYSCRMLDDNMEIAEYVESKMK